MAENKLSYVYDQLTLTLGALAANTAVLTASKIDASRRSGFRIVNTEYAFTYQGKTTDEGPISVGLAPSLNVTEIAEIYLADPQASNDHEADAESRRFIKQLFLIDKTSTTSGADAGGESHMNYRTVKVNWSIAEGDVLNWYAMNHDTAGLMTGTLIVIIAKHTGVWLRD